MQFTRSFETKNLIDYCNVIIRYKYIIIFSVLFMLVLALFYNSKLVPIYRANASMIIDQESFRSPLTGQRSHYESYLSETMSFNTHFELITSRPVLELVIEKLNLMDKISRRQGGGGGNTGIINKWENYISQKENPVYQWLVQLRKNILLIGMSSEKEDKLPPVDRKTGLINMIRGMVQIEPIEDTRILNLIVHNPNPKMAMDVANAVGQSYIDFNISNRMKSSSNTMKWLSENLYEIKAKLEEAEEELSGYKQRVQLISGDNNQEMIAFKIREFNDSYIQARNRRLELNVKLKELEKFSKSNIDTPSLRSLVTNAIIDRLYQDLLTAEMRLSEISKVYKTKHPMYIQLAAKIEDTKMKLREEIVKEISNFKAEQSVLLAREKVIKKTIADLEKNALETGRKEFKQDILKRNVEMNEKLYNTILSRIKESNVTGKIDMSNIRIVEMATLPRNPVGPNKLRNIFLAVMIGFIFSITGILLWDYFDKSIYTGEDVEKYLELPVLAVIPYAEREMKNLK